MSQYSNSLRVYNTVVPLYSPLATTSFVDRDLTTNLFPPLQVKLSHSAKIVSIVTEVVKLSEVEKGNSILPPQGIDSCVSELVKQILLRMVTSQLPGTHSHSY